MMDNNNCTQMASMFFFLLKFPNVTEGNSTFEGCVYMCVVEYNYVVSVMMMPCMTVACFCAMVSMSSVDALFVVATRNASVVVIHELSASTGRQNFIKRMTTSD